MYVLIQSEYNDAYENSTQEVVDFSYDEEELKQKATLYNKRSNELYKYEDDAREWYDNHRNDESLPEIPEKFLPFIEIDEHEDMDGTLYQSLEWNIYYERISYHVQKVIKAYFAD